MDENLFERVSSTFSDYQEVKVLKGNVIDVLPTLDIAKVAFAHIDMNARTRAVRFRALSPADDERRMHQYLTIMVGGDTANRRSLSTTIYMSVIFKF